MIIRKALLWNKSLGSGKKTVVPSSFVHGTRLARRGTWWAGPLGIKAASERGRGLLVGGKREGLKCSGGRKATMTTAPSTAPAPIIHVDTKTYDSQLAAKVSGEQASENSKGNGRELGGVDN